MIANTRTSTAPPIAATMTFMPSQSVTPRSPGLPARASRLAVRASNDELVMRATVPASLVASGRMVRSKNGCWSSSSSRLRAFIDPSWVSLAWTGSTAGRLATAMKISRMAAPAAIATRSSPGDMAQTSMSTILRMAMKPRNIMNPPITRMITPAGSPRMAGGWRTSAS